MNEEFRDFAEGVMLRRGFCRDAIAYIMYNTVFEIRNADRRGGGSWTKRGGVHYVTLGGYQEEACVHECAHVWYWDFERGNYLEILGAVELMAGDERGGKPYDVARVYMEVMWDGERWNYREMYAGMVSCVMGDSGLFPDYARGVWLGLLEGPEISTVYIPVVAV